MGSIRCHDLCSMSDVRVARGAWGWVGRINGKCTLAERLRPISGQYSGHVISLDQSEARAGAGSCRRPSSAASVKLSSCQK